MKRILTIAAFLFLCCSLLCAQTEESDQENPASIEESEESEVSYDFHVLKEGNSLINVNIALSIPIRPEQLKLGGILSIGYSYMITDLISAGGELSFSYNSTIGNNVLYFIPFLGSVGFHPTFGNFELSLSLLLGGVLENYLDRSYFGLAVKPEVGLYYKLFSEWTVGASAGLFILPQWYGDSSKNYTSLIPEARIGVKYIF
ncbi:MAG: hypothetical protein K5930_13655 [Treponemataceae bacterium]|nr:hypothetical protein [Treponemataceae bacterium]